MPPVGHCIEYQGECHSERAWARLRAIPQATLRQRLHVLGWTMAQALGDAPPPTRASVSRRPKAPRAPSPPALPPGMRYCATHERAYYAHGNEWLAMPRRRLQQAQALVQEYGCGGLIVLRPATCDRCEQEVA